MQDSVTYQAIKREGREEGREEGRREASLTFAFRLLEHKFGQLSASTELSIRQLNVSKLEHLVEAVLDFESMADLNQWLAQQDADTQAG